MKTPLFILLFGCVLAAAAQTVQVSADNAFIQGEKANGFSAAFEGSAVDLESFAIKYLKSYGKNKKLEGAYAIMQPVINGKSYPAPFYMLVKDKSKAELWIGIKPSEWTDPKPMEEQLQKLIYNMAVAYRKSQVQAQIDESVRAYEAVARQQQRLLNQNKDYNSKIELNKKEKTQLEQSIEMNRQELESLNKRIEKNKKEQDSIAVAAEQIKKVIEMHKQRQSSIN